jgi:prevent-host-death family protein
MVNMVLMRQASLVHAKAHLSELVDAAEHRGVTTIIKRHGKASAAIVPIDLVPLPKKAKRRGMTAAEIEALWATFEGQGERARSAVEDLLAGRR